MGRNIVICSEGTGNTFDKSVSNVTRLVKLLALDKSQEQIVVYDQGIGTNARRLDAVKDYHKSIPQRLADNTGRPQSMAIRPCRPAREPDRTSHWLWI